MEKNQQLVYYVRIPLDKTVFLLYIYVIGDTEIYFHSLYCDFIVKTPILALL